MTSSRYIMMVAILAHAGACGATTGVRPAAGHRPPSGSAEVLLTSRELWQLRHALRLEKVPVIVARDDL